MIISDLYSNFFSLGLNDYFFATFFSVSLLPYFVQYLNEPQRAQITALLSQIIAHNNNTGAFHNYDNLELITFCNFMTREYDYVKNS